MGQNFDFLRTQKMCSLNDLRCSKSIVTNNKDWYRCEKKKTLSGLVPE